MKRQKNGVFIDNYFEFIADPEGLSHEDVLQELKAEGIDTDKTRLKIDQIVKAGLEKRRMAWREKAEKKRSLIEKILSDNNTFNNVKEQIGKFLSAQGEPQLLQAYCRNKKDDLSEKDLLNLMNDIEDMNLLDDFFKEERK